jgi:hypothetical protein
MLSEQVIREALEHRAMFFFFFEEQHARARRSRSGGDELGDVVLEMHERARGDHREDPLQLLMIDQRFADAEHAKKVRAREESRLGQSAPWDVGLEIEAIFDLPAIEAIEQ